LFALSPSFLTGWRFFLLSGLPSDSQHGSCCETGLRARYASAVCRAKARDTGDAHLNSRAISRQDGGIAPPTRKTQLRERELQRRRAAMLSAVRNLVLKDGIQAVTMRAVADAVGASTTMVYSLFPDKATLISHALERDFIQLTRQLLDAAGSTGNTTERLRRVCHAYADHGLAHPLQYRLMFMEQRPRPTIENAGIEYGNLSEDAYALVCGLVVELAAEKGLALPAQEVQTVAQIVWEGMHGLVALRLSTDEDPWFARLPLSQHLDILFDVLMVGIAARWNVLGET